MVFADFSYQLILQSKMALFAYFCKKKTYAQLPDPCSPISQLGSWQEFNQSSKQGSK